MIPRALASDLQDQQRAERALAIFSASRPFGQKTLAAVSSRRQCAVGRSGRKAGASFLVSWVK